MRLQRWGIWLMMLLLGWQGIALAQVNNMITLHGFGGWAYGTTDNENRYMVGNHDGDFDAVNLTLNISANPYENLHLYTQTAYNEAWQNRTVALDYAFAEWSFSDALQFRVGKIKAPFMFYTEIYDVGTLRPFFMLPQGLYRDLAAKAYKGAGITGTYLLGPIELLYDVYGGSLDLQTNQMFDAQNVRFVPLDIEVRNLFGGRMTLRTPIEGLQASFSGYTGKTFCSVNNYEIPNYVLNDTYTVLGGSVEYVWKNVLLRGEYIWEVGTEVVDFDTGYAEAAYHLTDHWQLAARYEIDRIGLNSPEFAMMPASLLEHQDLAVGLNYWFNNSFVLKGAYHYAQGNRFAAPGNPQEYLQNSMMNSFDDTTGLIIIGAQFSF